MTSRDITDCDHEFLDDYQQEPVAKVRRRLDGHIGWNPKFTNLEHLPEEGTPLYTTPPTAPNLNCKSVQRRLATGWGYVRKEEYDMAKVAVVRQMRDAAVAFAAQYAQAAEDAYEQSGSRFDDGEANAARGIEEAIAALPIPGEEK